MYWLASLSFIQQFLLLYLVVINITTFFFFGLDKLKSQFNSRRISEKGLWFLSFIGGSGGGLLGMHFFRHKTKKTSFQLGIAIIILLQITLIFFLFR